MKATYLLLVLTFMSLAVRADEKPLEVEVLRTSAGSLYVNIALIKGEKDAVLVDVPFTRADAYRVAAMVLDSGKHLTTIFVTHDHPDHYFAMEVLTQAFPDVEVVAHPTVVADIWRSLPYKVKRWSPMLGANAPRMPTAPHALAGDTIMLEGRELKVLGPMQGDHVHATALWVPSIRALIAGDLLFNQIHLWLGEHDRQAILAWRDSVDQLEALHPDMVIAAHTRPGLGNDRSAITFTRDYIDFWLQASARARDSADLRQAVQQRFPETIDVLNDFILGNSSRVTMGEEPVWTE